MSVDREVEGVVVTGAVVVAGDGVTVFTRAGGCGWTVVVEGVSSRRRVSRDVEVPLGDSTVRVVAVVVVVVPTLAGLPF